MNCKKYVSRSTAIDLFVPLLRESPLAVFIYLIFIMKVRSKKYKKALEIIDRTKKYNIDEAIELVKKVSYSKFDWSIELHVKTNADPRYQDQIIRWTVILPHWTWKQVRVAAYVSDDKIQEALSIWADIAWNKELLQKIQSWNIDFDVLITTPDLVKDLAPVAKILWPRWLMPSPKAWTVTNDLSVIKQFKSWRVEFKLDKWWNIHLIIWKVSFENEKIKDNLKAALEAIKEARPSWLKWKLFKNITLAPTMWPWISIEYN